MKVTLIFPSLTELNRFLDAIKNNGLIHDYNNLSLTGEFKEKDLELAEHVFHAIVIETK
ncbi:MAG: hypothetical protein ACJ748_14760 [Flavisolibacter sp.]